MRSFHGFAFTFFLFQKAFSQSIEASINDVTNSFTTAGIVPAVVPVFSPSAVLDVHYSFSGEGFALITGETLQSELTDDEPTLSLTQPAPANETEKSTVNTGPFVVMLLDADGAKAQNSTRALQTLYFLKGDFSVDSSGTNITSRTEAIVEYIRPTTPYSQDPHRYVFLVFNQTSAFQSSATSRVNSTDEGRQNFNLTSFASAVNLGRPVAGNYFLIEPADNTTTKTSSSARSTATGGFQASFTRTDVPATLTPLLNSGERNVVGLATVLGIFVTASLSLLA